MNDDLNNKLKQLAEMLGGNEKMSDNLSGLLSMLANSSGNEKSTQAAPEEEPPKDGPPIKMKAYESPLTLNTKEDDSNKNELQDNVEMMRKVKDIMDTMRNNNDPRINLLTAIKPFLSNNRQQKISNCIRLFQVTQITKLMSDPEKTI
ncbi:hypothetical protein [Acetivibrio mesophilus]|uniref:Uncharacterized protein n=1 Tax=Acetivibrio mesophilus TaxID=2487273 RepID=A0A4Q0I3P7_9FIRM|nr:hypothetical protein [Acetivibrio mesophilus]ODM26673.1 hypothetical protein A7W90_10850 [Clostridium sp. Bc-iso-3]RXE58893.1 hypothetical protein EFD62_09640 [Acetivibrio mesophilus]HHV28440.1 hypothetical protein [Clostridium sp.]